jgi:hypothetical protein
MVRIGAPLPFLRLPLFEFATRSCCTLKMRSANTVLQASPRSAALPSCVAAQRFRAAAAIFSLVSMVWALPRWASANLAQCSAVSFLPLILADIFARVSADGGLRRIAMLIFARVSGECGKRTLLFADALIFAMVSGESRLPRWAALIFARLSGECRLPRRHPAPVLPPKVTSV